jgi:hypothetical protein
MALQTNVLITGCARGMTVSGAKRKAKMALIICQASGEL